MDFNSSARIVINISRAQSRSRDLPSKIQKQNEIKRGGKTKRIIVRFLDDWRRLRLNIPSLKGKKQGLRV